MATFDIDRLVDEQKFDRFNLGLLVWSFLAMFTDGFEIASLGLAVPHIVREWHVAPAAIGPVASASLFGILIGAPLFGWLGDRYGRRFAIISGCAIFGATTLAVVATTGLGQIMVLRFLTGIGMGGLMPNTVALNSELSPRRLRAKLIILMFMGITLGSAAPGIVAAFVVPEHGWKSLFLLGGIVPLAVALGLFFFLPESVKYLATRPDRRRELLATLRRMRRDVAIPDDAAFTVPAAPAGTQGAAGAGIRPIFTGGLLPITLLLWLCFATALMANYFLNSWMPLLFEAKGASHEEAALVATMYHLGATVGGLGMSFVLDRFGFLIIAGMLALAAPAILAIGIPGMPNAVLAGFTALAGFCVLGAQFGANAAAGLIYPTAYRAKGAGLAFAVGRFGSVLGPLVGGMLIAMKLSLPAMLLAVAAPMLLGAGAALILARLTVRRFGSLRLDDSAAGRGDQRPA
jgi:AAHS family 4-hydroxybenzoate transporter-like MFS transporter